MVLPAVIGSMGGSMIETKWDDEDRKSAITKMLAQELRLPAYLINHFGMHMYIAYFALTMHLLLIVSNSGGSRSSTLDLHLSQSLT